MEQGRDINRMSEKALNSIDGIQRAEPEAWFFSRVKAKLTRDDKTSWAVISSYLSKPSVAIAGLCLVLALNVAFLVGQKAKAPERSYSQAEQQLVSDNESIIASSSSFEYENLLQP